MLSGFRLSVRTEPSFKLNITCSCPDLVTAAIAAFYRGKLRAPVWQSGHLFVSFLIRAFFFFQLCLGAPSQPLSGCIRLPLPGALDPVCDPVSLAPLLLRLLCSSLLTACPPRGSRSGPPAPQPTGGGRGPWGRDGHQRTQAPRHEQRGPSAGQGSGDELHPASLQALQLA